MLKKILLWSCVFSTVVLCGFSGLDSREERCAKAAKCYGRIRITNSGADYRVRKVSSGADLRVEVVSIAPTSPGRWEIVEIGEDYSVEFVEAFEDFTVEFVNIDPGVSR